MTCIKLNILTGTWYLLYGVAQRVVDVITRPGYHGNHWGTTDPSGKCELYTESLVYVSLFILVQV